MVTEIHRKRPCVGVALEKVLETIDRRGLVMAPVGRAAPQRDDMRDQADALAVHRFSILSGQQTNSLKRAAHSFWVEHQIDRTSQFVRNEIAYEIGAIAGSGLRFHRRAVALLPDYRQSRPISVQLTIPI